MDLNEFTIIMCCILQGHGKGFKRIMGLPKK